MGLRIYLFVFILLFSIVVDGSNTFLFAFILRDISYDYNLTIPHTALIGFLPQVTATMGGQFIGFISDKWGRKVGIIVSLLLSSGGAFLVGFGDNIWLLVAGRMLSGLTFTGTWTACTTLINESIPGNVRGRGSAVVSLGFPLSNILCAGIVGFFGQKLGWRTSFNIIGLILIVCSILVMFRVEESPLWKGEKNKDFELNKKKGSVFLEIFSGKFRNATLMSLAISTLCVFGGFSIHGGIPSILDEIGFFQGEIPGMAAFVWLIGALGYISFGYFADKYNKETVFQTFIMATFICSLLLGTIVPFFQHFYTVEISRIGGTITLSILMYFTGLFAGFSVIFTELYPVNIRATALGLIFSVGRIGSALSPYVSQILFQKVGFGRGIILVTLPFFLAGILVPRLVLFKSKTNSFL